AVRGNARRTFQVTVLDGKRIEIIGFQEPALGFAADVGVQPIAGRVAYRYLVVPKVIGCIDEIAGAAEARSFDVHRLIRVDPDCIRVRVQTLPTAYIGAGSRDDDRFAEWVELRRRHNLEVVLAWPQP